MVASPVVNTHGVHDSSRPHLSLSADTEQATQANYDGKRTGGAGATAHRQAARRGRQPWPTASTTATKKKNKARSQVRVQPRPRQTSSVNTQSTPRTAVQQTHGCGRKSAPAGGAWSQQDRGVVVSKLPTAVRGDVRGAGRVFHLGSPCPQLDRLDSSRTALPRVFLLFDLFAILSLQYFEGDVDDRHLFRCSQRKLRDRPARTDDRVIRPGSAANASRMTTSACSFGTMFVPNAPPRSIQRGGGRVSAHLT